MMKPSAVYWAGPFATQGQIWLMASRVASLYDIGWTSSWLSEDPDADYNPFDQADRDINDIVDADLLVLVLPDDADQCLRGAFWEVGFAHGISKPVHIIGKPVKRNIFLWLPEFKRFDTLTEWESQWN